MKKSPIKTKSYLLAIKIVELYKRLSEHRKEYVLSKQVLKSGTSVGANIREAIQAESKADFIHQMCIALKEVLRPSIGSSYLEIQTISMNRLLFLFIPNAKKFRGF